MGGLGHSTSSLHLQADSQARASSRTTYFSDRVLPGVAMSFGFPTTGYSITISALSGNSLSSIAHLADLRDNSLPDESQQFIHK
jgi:hypothetical protein